jgi:beta-lactamase class C
MKDQPARRALLAGIIASLLPLAAGSVTQDTGHWRGAIQRPAATANALPEPLVENVAGVSTPTLDIARFESIAEALVDGGRIPGLAMAIVKDGKVLSARGYGITDTHNPQPVDAHTVFRLASLSKSFAGTMTGILVNDGVLRWDSHLTDYVPEFRMSRPDAAQQVTVADILSHRTGLTRNAFDRDLEANANYHDLTLRIADAPMTCAPGDCYAYQNVAFSLIGDIVFATTGRFYSESVASRIFKPLGMNDASYGLEGLEASARWAKPHVRGRGGWVSLTPKPSYYRVAPAAGVNASISDMAQWLIAHAGHRPDVLPAPLLETLHTQIVSTPTETRSSEWRRTRLNSAGYAIGWRDYEYAGHKVVFHGGAVQGYRGMMALVPEQDFGLVVLWNSESPLPSGLLPTILDAAFNLPAGQWLDDKTLTTSAVLYAGHQPSNAGTSAAAAKASPP